MPKTLTELLADIRFQIDEPHTKPFNSADLTRLVNDACRDIARRAEVIQSFNTSVSAVAGTNKYDLPTDVIRVHRVEFVPTGSTQVYPVHPATRGELDRMWGLNQSSQSSYPSFFTIWGTPGITTPSTTKLQIQFWPVPSQTGTFNIYYYRVPYQFLDPDANPAELAKEAEYPEGWDDLVVQFVSYKIKRRRRDDTWQSEREEYEAGVQNLIEITRQYHDQSQTFVTATGLHLPGWLVGVED